MGKRSQRAGRRHDANRYPRMGQPNIRDRSGAAEQRSVCGIADDDRSRVATGSCDTADANIASCDNDDIAKHASDVRGQHARRLRVHWGKESALVRTFDAANANRLCNDPSIFPHISVPGIDKIDLTEALNNPHHVCLEAIDDEGRVGGCFVLFFQEFGTYELHTNFLPEWRGNFVIEAIKRCFEFMFISTNCMGILTRVPAFNKGAALLTPRMGFTKEFERENAWPTKNGFVGCSYWSLTYRDWSRHACDSIAWGKWFHQRLDEAFARQGLVRANAHGDEDCHDLRAGLVLQMAFAGQLEKGIALYNQWARFAGYALINLVSRNPVIVDIGDALLQFDADYQMKVLQCRQP